MGGDYWSTETIIIYFRYNDEFKEDLNKKINKINKDLITSDYCLKYSYSNIHTIEKEVKEFNDEECKRKFDEFNRCYKKLRQDYMNSIPLVEFNPDTIFTFEDDEKSCAIHRIEYRSVVVYNRFKDINYTIYTCEQPDDNYELDNIEICIKNNDDTFNIDLMSIIKHVIKVDRIIEYESRY